MLSNVNLWRDDSSADDQDIWPVHLPQFLDELGDQGLVSGGECADANTVDVCVDSLLGNLQGCLFTRAEKQRNEPAQYSGGCGQPIPASRTFRPVFINQTLRDFMYLQHLKGILMIIFIQNWL